MNALLHPKYIVVSLMDKKFISPENAQQKAENFCSYQERSQQEVRDKIYSWGLHRNDVENILSNLITNGFLQEARFASSFARGKFRIKKWGRNKIREALRGKKISESLINKALSEIDEKEYKKILNEVIQIRTKNIIEKNPLKKKYKIASYVISRGFETELVWEMINQSED